MTIDLAMLADRIAIEERLYMYAHLLDSQQYHRLADEIFTDDGDIDFGGQRAHGRAEIEATLLGYVGMLKGSCHTMSNVIIHIAGDEARSNTKVLAWHWFHRADGNDYAPTDLLGVGGYIDRWRRTPLGWRIGERRGINYGTGIGVGDVPPEMQPIFDGMRGRVPAWP